MTSTIRSASSTISSKLPRERVRTPRSCGRSPVIASIWPARAPSSSANAEPTVPWPSRPMRKVSGMARGHHAMRSDDVARGELVVGLAAHDEARVAAADEDDRRAGDAVVAVGHRVAVSACGRGDDDVAHARVGELGIADDEVARLAVLADQVAVGAAARPRGDLRLVARAAEHRTQVVGHAAVDGAVEVDVALD